MCDCAGDASCVLRFCRAISLDAPKVADVRAAADCVEDLRGAAPDEVEAICAQWKVLAKGKFRRAVAALQEEVRQGADGAFDHEACIEAFAAALQALEPEAGEDDDEDDDYDWGQLGVSWKDGGDIVLSDGTVLHAVGTD